jgi:hypothetical protein
MNPEDTESLRMKQAEYSYEKNKSVSAMLGLYSFLNLAAIGLIFYIAKSR